MRERQAVLELPPFPSISLRMMQLLSEENVKMKQVADLISADQVFASEILRLSNSPLFGLRREVRSVLQATAILGLERVKGAAMAVSMKAYIADSMWLPESRACWRHSLASALLADQLSVSSQLEQNSAFTLGLLHDLGRVALLVLHPASYVRLLSDGAETAWELLERERKLYSFDHCEAGSWLAEQWGLPQDFVEVTAHHHSVAETDFSEAVSLVRQSCQLAEVLGFPSAPTRCPPSFDEIFSTLPEAAKKHLFRNPQDLSLDIGSKILMFE